MTVGRHITAPPRSFLLRAPKVWFMRSFRQFSAVPLFCLALTACNAGDANSTAAQEPVAQQASALDGTQLFGLHDPGGYYLMSNAGRNGWIVYTEQITDTRPRTYRTDHGALVRINQGYGSVGTLPCEDQYDTFATAAANLVRSSTGASTWIIGNEGNLPAEWPTCNGVKQPITPERYVRVFKKVRDAIKAVPNHGGDRVVMQGVGVWNSDIGMSWVQYYEAILNGLGANGLDGIALHTYSRGSDPTKVSMDQPNLNNPNDKFQWGFRAYRDFLNATPHWARSLPVYITETDQNDPWLDANNGWVRAAYSEIHNWNAGANSHLRQKIQAVALYRWDGNDAYSINNRSGVQQDFSQAMLNSYPSPAAGMPAEPRTNECSLENTGVAAWTPPETGFTVSGYIHQFWRNNGGLSIFGFPWSNARRTVNSSGSYVCSQLFERHRIEIQLNNDGTVKFLNGQPFITLGRVGAERMIRDQDMITFARVGYSGSGGNTADCQSWAGVAFKVCGSFKAYWNSGGLNGGSDHLSLFGYPTSEPFRYTNSAGQTYVAQYFERARFELHGTAVLGGLLGSELKFGDRK